MENTAILPAHPDYVLACGIDRQYLGATGNFRDVNKPNLPQESGPERVIAYYQMDACVGAFYGLMPKKLIQKIGLKPGLAGDVVMLASLAFAGKVKILETTMLHRATGKHGHAHYVRVFNVPLFFNKNYYGTAIVLNASKDFFRKCRLSFQVFTIFSRKWHIFNEIITKTPLLWLVFRLIIRVIRPPYRLLKKCFLKESTILGQGSGLLRKD